MKRLRGTLLLEGLVQERLDVGLMPMRLHVGEILGSLDIGHREPLGNDLQGDSPPFGI